MSRWLFKSDPEVYSWNHLLKDKKTTWDGVSNNLALKHLRSVKKGDEIFIYHSGDDKAVIGIAKAASDAYAHPSQENSRFAVVDIVSKEPLKNPVTLQAVKRNAKFASWELVRMSRLSVMPVSEVQWNEVLRLGKKADDSNSFIQV